MSEKSNKQGNKIQDIKKQILSEIKPTKENLKEIETEVKEFIGFLKNKIKKDGVEADVFVGGSFAKGTFLKKENYDVDIFIRFDKKHDDRKISDLTEDILKGVKFKVNRLHGSRDYFQAIVDENLVIEIVPVRKISKPEEAVNITDMTYSHVKYTNKNLKTDKIKDEIRIAKAFVDGAGVYGAESYISGFSGYSIELLVFKFGSFENFLKEIINIDGKEKKIIDIEKQFKKPKDVLMDLSESKLGSPIILIDPTYKYRNVLAALSEESFQKLKARAKEFLKKPAVKLFYEEKIDFEKLRKKVNGNKKKELLILRADTNKDVGDVAGTKLLKFFNYLNSEVSRFFKVNEKYFSYDKQNSAEYVFILEKKDKIVFSGPFLKDLKNVKKFKSEHKKTLVKGNRVYAEEKVDFLGKEFVIKFREKYSGRLKEMSIVGLEVA